MGCNSSACQPDPRKVSHTLCAAFNASDCGCGCGQSGCTHNADVCDMPGGNVYTCGTGAFQYNKMFTRCESLAPGCSVTFDICNYMKCDGSIDSMDIVRRFYLVNKSASGCGSGVLKIMLGDLGGVAGPGNDVFTMSNSYEGWQPFEFSIYNTGDRPAEFCFAVLGVRK